MNAITSLNATFVRASSLTGYPDCPRRGAASLFRREIQEMGYNLRQTGQGIGATVGTSVHAAAALLLREKAITGKLPPLDVATDAAVEACREAVAEGVDYDKTTENANEAEEQIVRMTRSYRAEIAPDIEPIMVEERLEAVVPWVTQGIVLTGQSDVVAREPGRIRDLKTGAKGGKTHTAQVGSYSLLARTKGLQINSACIDFVQRVHITGRTKIKAQPPAVSTMLDVAICETAAANVLRHIDGDLKVFREGDPDRGMLPGDAWAFLANPGSMLCSAKYCSAFGSDFCHEHAAIISTDED